MAPQTQHDDDLLIITDDSDSSESGEMDFTLNFDDESSDNIAPTAVATETAPSPETSLEGHLTLLSNDISDTATPEVVISDMQDTGVSTESSEDASQNFQFTLHEDAGMDTVATPEENSLQEDNSEEGFSFAIGSDDTMQDNTAQNDTKSSQTPSQGVSSHEVKSMNDILQGTIEELMVRQESIAAEKSSLEQVIAHLKEQEADIKNQITAHTAEITDHDEESAKITASVEQLESMKQNPVKEHNAKRTVKK